MKKTILLSILFLKFYSFCAAQVNANFSISNPSDCTPLVTNFTDLSTGMITSWNWSLGNGNNSSFQNPGATYLSPGNYTVCLTVSDGVYTDTFCDTVIAYDIPIVNFAANDTQGCANFNVNFTNLTATGPGIQSVIWNFGDGNISSALNPSHTYSAGTYDVTLIVTDSSGCVGEENKLSYINSISNPIAQFTATDTQSCANPTIVNFTNTSTDDNGATYSWDFGDGTSSTLENPSHNYTSAGSFDVKLIVTKNGCIDSILKTNFVVIQAQSTDFSVSDSVICVGESISFTDLSALTPNAWAWDFGDGSALNTNQNPNHVFNTPGTYTISLNTFLTGCDDNETKTNYIVVNDLPSVNLSSDVTDTCDAPFSVNFSSTTSPNITSYNWNFGDGNTSNLANPNHIYTTTGNFNVSLTVTNINNCSANVDSISLINISPPIAQFSVDSTEGCVPRIINITDQSITSNTISNWYWDFGDGNTANGIQNPTHTYIDTGRFTISLAIVDNYGCTDTISNIEVRVGDALTPDFSLNPTSACKTDPLTFVNLTDTTGYNDLQWFWNFGDGGTDIVFEPNYEYGDTGTFDVSLSVIHNGCRNEVLYPQLITINPPIAILSSQYNCSNYNEISFFDNSIGPDLWTWDINGDTVNTQDVINYSVAGVDTVDISLYVENTTHGCIDSISQQIIHQIPITAFEVNDSLGCAPFTVQFTNNSTLGINYTWDFGDGTPTSSAVNPNHTYQNPGIYSVKLTVENSLNCTDSIIYTNLITAIGPIANFNTLDTSGCKDFRVMFNDLSTISNGQITQWSWNFGDGSPLATNQSPNHTYVDTGTFSISLTITDTSGCTNSISKTNYIHVMGIVPNFNVPPLHCVDAIINFTNTSSSLNGNITNYLWNFGDGNTSTLENPSHSYSQAGVYDISLYAQDDNGCDSTLVVQNAITIDSLHVDFTADSTVGDCTGFVVNFESLATPNPISWQWDFGDGTGASSENPSTTFSSVGTFDISLIVENTAGCRDSILKSNFITVNGPYGDLSISTDSGCLDLDVEFTMINTNSISQTWDMGDGTVVTNSDYSYNHTYTSVNTFHPVVILVDSSGCVIPYSFDSIQTGDLSIAMDIDTNYICTPDQISFSDLSSANPPINYWNWDFGDGNTSPQSNPTHTYLSGGVFDIQLIAANDFCTDTITKLQHIVSDASTNALFDIISPNIQCPPVLFNFTNLSSADSSIASWNWDFGNGDLSTVENPSAVNYTNDGLYTVSLNITTIKGCQSSFSDTLRVNEIPSFNFNVDSITLCFKEDTTINFLDEAFQYTWTPSTNLSCSDCPNPTITNLGDVTYFVNAVNSFGCEKNDTLTFISSPLPNITVSENEKVTVGTEVDLNVFSPTATEFYWTPDNNLSCTNCENTVFTANETTAFIAEVIDSFGCRNYDTVLVDVFEVCDGSFLLFPNVFTPNDDGRNDVFKTTRKQNLDAEIKHFRIFDRWGKLVFETNNLDEAWDGNGPNGAYMNNGVYVYTLELVCPDGTTKIHNGNVTLIR